MVPWKRRGFKVLLLTYYWPNVGVHHVRGGEGHMAVLAHMAALTQEWFSDTQAIPGCYTTTLAVPAPVKGGLPPMSGPSSRGHTESATDPS